MLNPTFNFFEAICGELATKDSIVITREDFGDLEAPLIDDLRAQYKRNDSVDAIADAVAFLTNHFNQKASALPFTYDAATGRFARGDFAYIDFVDTVNNLRSEGIQSREFEVNVTHRLALKITGAIYRVGWSRTTRQLKADFNVYLEGLGFRREVLLGKEKDGGLDILWLPPLGSIPYRPIISVQCKNAEIRKTDFERPPLGTTKASLDCHKGYQPDVPMYCVFYNDYIHSAILPKKRLGFVPLGISDLALTMQNIVVDIL